MKTTIISTIDPMYNSGTILIYSEYNLSEDLVRECINILKIEFEDSEYIKSTRQHQYSFNKITDIELFKKKIAALEELIEYSHKRYCLPNSLSFLLVKSDLQLADIRILFYLSKYLTRKFDFKIVDITNFLLNNISITNIIIKLFKSKFSLFEYQENNIANIILDIKNEKSIYIISAFLHTIAICVRSNAYNNIYNNVIVFKFKPEIYDENITQVNDIDNVNIRLLSILNKLLIQLPEIKNTIISEDRFLYESFVIGDYFDGIHFRNNMIARGGIRLSDRHDYRIEVLQLMYAQNIKNAVIVPNGAKGGFIIDKHQYQKFIKCFPKKYLQNYDIAVDNMDISNIDHLPVISYTFYITGLLQVIDNIIVKQIHTNNNEYQYDNDDTYLVVAADKGTASFSDHANAIAIKNNYWLHDAFASGGQSGYNHKEIGITSKSSIASLLTQWNIYQQHNFSIKNIISHFDYNKVHNIDLSNIYKILIKHQFHHISYASLIHSHPRVGDAFYTAKVIAIGSMTGDVCGNGLLLLGKVNLIAAISHNYIMIDPKAMEDHIEQIDAKYNKRQYLFDNNLNWDEYKDVLSQGGQIYNRNAEYCQLTEEVRDLLQTHNKQVSVDELIHALLQIELDIIWNGGIGTYFKSDQEKNIDIGDSSNDHLRCNSNSIKSKFFVEGGNLGMTSLARIDYDKHGGMVRADFIDNTGGVYCSDYEVNIKILLKLQLDRKDINITQRDDIMLSVKDDVVIKLLNSLTEQSEMISLFKLMINYREQIGSHIGMNKVFHDKALISLQINNLIENIGNIDKQSEVVMHNIIPSILNKQLTDTEASYIASYTKIFVYNFLLHNIEKIILNEACIKILINYFPSALHKYDKDITNHQFKHQILCSTISNNMVNILTPLGILTLISIYKFEPEVLIIRFCKIYNEELNLQVLRHGTNIKQLPVILSLINCIYNKFLNTN